MFICELGHVSKPRETMIRIATEIRNREYANQYGEVSYGWEVLKEVNVCQDHANELLGAIPETQ
jgi:hypothetical protein